MLRCQLQAYIAVMYVGSHSVRAVLCGQLFSLRLWWVHGTPVQTLPSCRDGEYELARCGPALLRDSMRRSLARPTM